MTGHFEGNFKRFKNIRDKIEIIKTSKSYWYDELGIVSYLSLWHQCNKERLEILDKACVCPQTRGNGEDALQLFHVYTYTMEQLKELHPFISDSNELPKKYEKMKLYINYWLRALQE